MRRGKDSCATDPGAGQKKTPLLFLTGVQRGQGVQAWASSPADGARPGGRMKGGESFMGKV